MGTKDTVLELFEKNRGFFISGEMIASDLGISRTAVWKAVKKLQKEGYDIKAVTNRGYCLAKNSDILSVQGICQYFNAESAYLRPEVFSIVESTNTVCREKANAGEKEGYVAIAGNQTRGRGRRGRSFFSPADTGIYMSILLNPEDYQGKMVLRLTTMAAVAVCEAIEALSDKKAAIKWVNDILIGGKKVCGILSEATYNLEDGKLDAVVVGIGINTYPPKNGFPDEFAGRAGCVFDEASEGMRNHLAAEILNRFMHYYNNPDSNSHREEYVRRSVVLGKDVTLTRRGRDVRAHALDLDENCVLIVRYEDGSTGRIDAGEISITDITDWTPGMPAPHNISKETL